MEEFEEVFIPNDRGGMDRVMIPKDMTLEEKIIKRIREKSRAEKADGGRIGFQDGTQRVAPAEFIEAAGKTYLDDLTKAALAVSRLTDMSTILWVHNLWHHTTAINKLKLKRLSRWTWKLSNLS